MSKTLDQKAKDFSNTNGNQGCKLMREVEYDTGRYVGYLAGFKDCEKEYEEKLRWTHVFEELPDLNSVIELKSENKRFLGIVKLKNYQGENRYYVQGMYQATGDIDILYNFSHWRKAIL